MKKALPVFPKNKALGPSAIPQSLQELKRILAEIVTRAKIDLTDPSSLFTAVLPGPRWQQRVTGRDLAKAWQAELQSRPTRQPISFLDIEAPYDDKKCGVCLCPTPKTPLAAQAGALWDDAVKEMEFYAPLLRGTPILSLQIHGLPDIFSAAQLRGCLERATSSFNLQTGAPRFIEFQAAGADPEKLAVARDHGFNFISFRSQPLDDGQENHERLKNAIDLARQAGFPWIHVDFVFGLMQDSASKTVDYFRRLAELSPTSVCLHRLTFSDVYLRPKEYRYDMFLRAEDGKTLLAAFKELGYEAAPWKLIQRRWFICRFDAPRDIKAQLLEMIPISGGRTSHLGIGQFSRSTVSQTQAYDRYLNQPFDPDKSLYQTVRFDLKEWMMHYIIASLETDSGINEDNFRACFGADLNDRFSSELAALRILGKIEKKEGGWRYLPVRTKERLFYALFFLMDHLGSSPLSKGLLTRDLIAKVRGDLAVATVALRA